MDLKEFGDEMIKRGLVYQSRYDMYSYSTPGSYVNVGKAKDGFAELKYGTKTDNVAHNGTLFADYDKVIVELDKVLHSMKSELTCSFAGGVRKHLEGSKFKNFKLEKKDETVTYIIGCQQRGNKFQAAEYRQIGVITVLNTHNCVAVKYHPGVAFRKVITINCNTNEEIDRALNYIDAVESKRAELEELLSRSVDSIIEDKADPMGMNKECKEFIHIDNEKPLMAQLLSNEEIDKGLPQEHRKITDDEKQEFFDLLARITNTLFA